MIKEECTLFADLVEELLLIREEMDILKNILFDNLENNLFYIHYLVISFDETYLIAAQKDNSIIKLQESLCESEFDQHKMKYLADMNSFIESEMHAYLQGFLDKLLNRYSFLFFNLRRIYKGLRKIECNGKTMYVLLTLSYKNEWAGHMFYCSVLDMVFRYVNRPVHLSYVEIYRIPEDAAHKVLSKSLPFYMPDSFLSKEYQRKYVVLDLLLKTINDISAMYYESSEGKGSIQFIESQDQFKGIELDTPILFYDENVRLIRKLLEASRNSPLIAYEDRIIGIANEPLDAKNTYIINILGHLHWNYSVNGIEQFVFVNSKYMFPQRRDSLKQIKYNLESLFDIGGENIREFMNFFSEMHSEKGLIMIITDDAQNESKRLCTHNRGILLTPFSIFNCNRRIICDLLHVDGALIVDPYGRCHAFGVILDGKVVSKGDASRGSRYNSARNYVESRSATRRKNKKYMGIVVSEDGMIDVFPPFFNRKKCYFSTFDAFR